MKLFFLNPTFQYKISDNLHIRLNRKEICESKTYILQSAEDYLKIDLYMQFCKIITYGYVLSNC